MRARARSSRRNAHLMSSILDYIMKSHGRKKILSNLFEPESTFFGTEILWGGGVIQLHCTVQVPMDFDSTVYLAVNGTVTSLPVFIYNIFNCVPKTKEAFTDLERHGGKWLMTKCSFWGGVSL